MPLLHEETTGQILVSSFEVINELGAGFLEGVYEKALAIALREKGLRVQVQFPLRVIFRGQCVGEYFADLLVEDKVIVKLKAVKVLAPEHLAQVINYSKATSIKVGLLINFGHPKLEYRRLYGPEAKLEEDVEDR
ncbi:MAG: GxxExxY protein [Terriglobia bacterium]